MTGTRYSTEEMLGRLIAFDTTSHRGNIPLIEFVEDYLGGWGVPHFRVDYEADKKTNLFATIGPAIAGGIVLSGHTDVVPVDGQPWTSDPFDLTAREDRLVGRGACDMKGFLAVCLAEVPNFLAAKLKSPIHLALSCDEEVGCKGVRPLVAHMRGNLPKPRAVIVGEPTSMQVVNAHKSAVTFSTEVTGHEAHSSLTHHGVNAILVAGELLSEIGRIRGRLIELGDPTRRFDPPYSTVHVGVIAGGTAKNIIPRKCSFQWETRLLPTADPAYVPHRFETFSRTLEPAMQAVAPGTGIATAAVNSVPGLAPEEDSPAESLALHLAGANSTHAVSYCTEAGLFQQIGIPAVICGPGSIEQAHKPDEYIDVSELRKCEAFMGKLVSQLS
ncbi:MAG: acetylornithine deacetylase [Aestuariivirga sp.]|uniref:acetylornithine deacetylase n=1 Tax=Aestuariivirga sp. TaxID=2650926 RepID=UPI0025B8FDFE|nr:acetylornithine deacetylase [Aestuariivirga sp.]MCA3559553.1 acetylornithine deacetylase [Aestuariivirga sp.]